MIIEIISIDELNIDECEGFVSKNRIEKSERLKHEDDKKRSIAVEYLFNCMLREYYTDYYNRNNTETAEIVYDEHSKPHLYEQDGSEIIHFSFSHSGKYAACMISDRPCGIDIEKHSERNIEKIISRVCTESEISEFEIKNTQNSTEEGDEKKRFYDIWTLKECVLKAVGTGLSLDMRSFELKKLHSSEGNTYEYMTSVDKYSYTGKVMEAPKGYSLSYMERA